MELNYLELKKKQRKYRNEIKNNREKINECIRNNIDNKYLKFIEINKFTLKFKLNKKMRSSVINDHEFLNNYIIKFIKNILMKSYGIKIDIDDLSILTDIYLHKNKLYVEI